MENLFEIIYPYIGIWINKHFENLCNQFVPITKFPISNFMFFNNLREKKKTIMHTYKDK